MGDDMNQNIKHVFILNPAAGKGEKQSGLCAQIERVCKEKGVDYLVHQTTARGEATAFVAELCSRYPDQPLRFYACGGDGTLSETVNGAYGYANASVGVVPVGTGNDFVRNFEGKQAFLDIAAQLDGQEQMLDLIKYNDRFCVNMINIGFDCEVVKQTWGLKKCKWIPSGMTYIAGLVITLIRKPGVKASVSLDGGEAQPRRMLLTAVANGAWCGGGFHSNPLALQDDGILDVLMIKNVSRVRFLSLVKSYKQGTFVHHPKARRVIEYAKCQAVCYSFEKTQSICVDGEVTDVDTLEICAVKNGLRFVVPAGVSYQPTVQIMPVGAC